MGYFSDIFKSDDAPVEGDDLEQTAGFFSQERGQQRSRDLNDAIKYYLGPYLGSSDGLVAKGGQLANPIVGMQDSGVAFEEGRYVDAVTDLAGAAVPLAAGVVAKPAARAVSKGMDDAVDMVSETLTGFSAKPKPFDPSRRKAMQQIGAAAVAAPVMASDAARGVLDEVIAPVVKKTAGAVNPLSQSLGKLDGMATDFQNGFLKGQDIFQRVKEGKYTNYWMTSRSNPELAAHDNSMNDLAEGMRNEFFDSVIPALTKDNITTLKDDELLFAASELSARADDAYIKAADFDSGALAESLDTSIQDVLDELSARGINTPETQKLLDDIEYRKDPYLEGAYAGEDVTTDALGLPPTNAAANMVPKDIGGEMPTVDAQTTQAFGTNGGPSMQSGPAEIGPQKRVDTRLPTEVVKDDTLKTGAMVSDGDSLMGNPNMYDNLVMMTDHYPGLKRLYSDDVAEIRGNITNRMTDNIVSLYDMSDQLGIAKDSANWYVGANRIANGLSTRFGISDTKSAGVLAVMSPQKDWFQNVGLGERIIKHHTELGPNAPWTPEMEAMTVTVPASRRGKGKANNTAWQDGKNGAILDAIKGKAWGQLETPMEKALWLRAYDEAHFGKNFREVSPEGDILGYDIKKDGNPSAIAHQGFGDIAKAVRILEGDGTLTSISPELGGNHKVRNFFNNILNPDSPNDVTVDTHQIAAGLFRPLGSSAVEVHHGLNGANIKGNPARWSNEGKAETGMAGSYGLYFDATTDAASLRGTLPREMQSISWEQLRTLFPNSLKQDKDFVSQTEGIWRAVDSGTLSSIGAREAIIKLAQSKGAGGVPAWKNYQGPRRDIGTYATTAGRAAGAGTLLLGSAGLATAQEEGFAPQTEDQ